MKKGLLWLLTLSFLLNASTVSRAASGQTPSPTPGSDMDTESGPSLIETVKDLGDSSNLSIRQLEEKLQSAADKDLSFIVEKRGDGYFFSYDADHLGNTVQYYGTTNRAQKVDIIVVVNSDISSEQIRNMDAWISNLSKDNMERTVGEIRILYCLLEALQIYDAIIPPKGNESVDAADFLQLFTNNKFISGDGWTLAAVIDEDAESCTIIAFYGDRSDVLNNYRR